MTDPIFTHATVLPLATPPEGEIHLWSTFLSRAAVGDVDPMEALSPAEHSRAARIASPSDRRRFVSGRALLRAILVRYLGDEPVVIESDEHGKPRLVRGDLQFSVTHAGGVLVVAISCRAVGVDLEPAGAAARIAPLAVGFTTRERAALDGLEGATGRRGLVTLWCAKEAAGKVLGEGLVRGLDALDASPLLDRPRARIVSTGGPLVLHRREPLPGYILVVASPPPVRRLVARRL